MSCPGPEGRKGWAGGPCVLLREAFFVCVCGKMLLLVLITGMAKLASLLQGKEAPLVRDKSPDYRGSLGRAGLYQPSCLAGM